MGISDSLWWFNGLNPENYSTRVTLTTGNVSPYSTVSWTVTRGQDKVNFENDQDTYTAVGDNNVDLYSTAASTPAAQLTYDVTISVVVNGLAVGQLLLAVPIPHHLVPLKSVDLADANRGFESRNYYSIEDQFNRVLPRNIGINEKWVGLPVSDFPGIQSWDRGGAGGALVNPDEWQGERIKL